MRNEYEMVTVSSYLDELVEKYLLNQKRNETNAKIVEALLA